MQMDVGRRRTSAVGLFILVGLWLWSFTLASAQVVGPDVAIVKTGPPNTTPGGVIVYTLTYRNDSTTLTATDVTITDIVPNNTVFVAGQSTAGWSCADGSGTGTLCTYTISTLAPGATGSVNFAVRVNSSLPAGVNEISNTATITYPVTQGVDPEPGDNASDRTVPVVGQVATPTATMPPPPASGPDLGVVKIDSGPASPGGIITYRITATNFGPGTATGVLLTETVPNNTVFVASASSAGWSCADGSPELTICNYTVGTLAQGQSALITFAARVVSQLPLGVNEIANAVTIVDNLANGPDPVAGNNVSAVITPLVIATATTAPTSVRNTPTPSNPTATPGGPTATPGGPTATPGGPKATEPPKVTGPTATPNIQVADPFITKAANRSEARVGDQVEFFITVTNPNIATVEGVRVVDDLEDAFELLSVEVTRGTVHVDGNRVEVDIGSMAPGEVVVIRILTQVVKYAEPPGNRNVAILSTTTPNENTNNNTSSVEVRIIPAVGPPLGEPVPAPPADPAPPEDVQRLPQTGAGETAEIFSFNRGEIISVASTLGVILLILGALIRSRKLKLPW